METKWTAVCKAIRAIESAKHLGQLTTAGKYSCYVLESCVSKSHHREICATFLLAIRRIKHALTETK